MKKESLRDLYVDELRELYDAETQLVDALPGMANAASAPDLKRALREHLEVTKEHVKRLEGLFDGVGQRPKRKRCIGIEGLLRETRHLTDNGIDKDVLDAALIVAVQKVEHYEMAAYGSARAHAGTLGETSAHGVLQETLNEEQDADRALTKIAEDLVNVEAAIPG